jgi:hypothetical protein
VDGRFLSAYATAFVAAGHVFVPVDPLLTRLADRIYYDGNELVIERNGRRIRIAVAPLSPGFSGAYVMAAPVLKALGATVHYDARERVLFVQSPPGESLASPEPFDAALPSPPPEPVFTPEPVATPRPIWTGSPLPRRTPLPFFTQPPATAPPSR